MRICTPDHASYHYTTQTEDGEILMPYSTTARFFHWGMALLVLTTVPAGFIMVQQGLDRSLQNSLFIYHKNIGVVLLLIVLARAAYRWRNPPAALSDAVPDWQRKIAALSHLSLYVLLIVMPLAGYIRVKAGGFPIESLDAMGVPSLVPRSEALADTAKAIHYFAGIALSVLIGLHIAAAAFHGVIRRDGVFSRMWPPVAPRNS